MKKGNLDEKDIKIINILQKNARTPFSDIAKELGITSVAVLNRFRNLQKCKIITGSLIQVDLSKFGFKYVANILVKIIPSENENLYEILEWINNQLDNRIIYNSAIGKNFVLIFAILKNTLELEKLVDILKSNNKVIKIETCKWTEMGKILALPENILLNYPVEG